MSAIIVSGLVSGALYALIASGLSLVWGSLGVFNFAHGALLMAGAYVAWWISAPEGLGLGLPVGILAALAFLIVAGTMPYLLLVPPSVCQAHAQHTLVSTPV